MATLNGTKIGLVDVAAHTNDGKVQKLAELLNEENPINDDIPMIECNNGDNHKSTQRTGLPTAAWRELNKGIQPSKSDKKPCTDTCGIMEGRSEIDEDIAELNGNVRENRAIEDVAFIESLNQGFAETLIYGDTNSTPEKFLGLAPRMDSLSAANAENIVNAAGSGSDNTSIFLAGWGENSGHGIYPRGTKAGLEVNDKGKEKVLDSDSNAYYAYVTQFKRRVGLVMKDWRYFGRVCNIDVSALTKDAATGADLIYSMIELVERVKDSGAVNQVIYVPKVVRRFLRHQMHNGTNMNLTWETFGGKRVMAFDGKPVRVVEAILETEAAIS